MNPAYTFFFEVDAVGITEAHERVAGVLTAPSFTKAMEQIEDYFGDDLIKVYHIELADISLFTVKNTNIDILHELFKQQ